MDITDPSARSLPQIPHLGQQGRIVMRAEAMDPDMFKKRQQDDRRRKDQVTIARKIKDNPWIETLPKPTSSLSPCVLAHLGKVIDRCA